MASLADPGRGGKQEVARARARALRPRASVLLSRGGRRQGGRWWAGPARGGGSWAGWWAARVRPGRLYSFYFVSLFFVLTLFSILQVCFEFGFETNSIYFASDNIFRSYKN